MKLENFVTMITEGNCFDGELRIH